MQDGKVVYITAGASGVGTALIQLCKQLFNCTVISSCSEGKMEFIRKLGCDYVFDSRKGNMEEIRKTIGEKYKQVDCIFDCIGGNTSSFHLDIIGQDGVWVLYGLLGGAKIQDLEIFQKLLWKRVKL